MAARDEGGTRKVDWFARILDASNKRKAALVEEAGESRVLEFRDPASSTYYFLHPSTYTPGKWQLSVIATDGSGPLSHQEYSDRRKAIEEVGSTGHYRVTDRRNPNMPLRFRDLNVGAIFVFASEAGVYSKAAGGTLAWQGARGPWEKISPREYIYANRPESPQVFKVGTINAEVVKAGDAQGPQRFAGRVRNPVLRYKKPLPDARQVEVDVWEERDRLSIVAYDSRFGARRKVIAEWWDDDARQMFEDGFFNARARGGLKQSVVEYLQDMGMVNKSRLFNPLNEREADELLDGALSDLAHAKTLKGPDGKAMQAYVFGKASKAGHAVAVYGEDWRQKDQGGKLSHVSRRLGQRAARMDRAYHGQLRGGNPSMLILGNPPTANSENYFSIASGLYWFAADYHSGQTSVIYSVLSRLDYKPGASERGPAKDDFEAREVYAYLRKLDKKRGGADAEAERLLAEVQAASSRDTNPRRRRNPLVELAGPEQYPTVEPKRAILSGILHGVEPQAGYLTIDGTRVFYTVADYYHAGAGHRSYTQLQALLPLIGRHVTARIVFRHAWGWTIMGRSNIRLSSGGKRGGNPANMLILGNPDITRLDDDGLRATFSWLSKTGMGRHFPGMPIGWYQIHQFAALDAIEAAAKAKGLTGAKNVRVKYDAVQVQDPATRRWIEVARARDIFNRADNKARGINPFLAKGYKWGTAKPEDRVFKTQRAADKYARQQSLMYQRPPIYRISEAEYQDRKARSGNPAPGTTATVTYSPEFQEFTVTTRDAARKVLGTYFTNDHADALGTARREAETVLDRTKRRPPNPLNSYETRRLLTDAADSAGAARVLALSSRHRVYANRAAGFAEGLATAAYRYAGSRKSTLAADVRRKRIQKISDRVQQRAEGYGANPGPCPKGCPPGVWRDPEFQRELAAYKKRHGSVPAEIRQINVPAGFPKYLSVYGRVPELKYDAPAHSTKGRRIHHFGKNGAKHTQPFAVTSAARGPKFLALVGGNFKAKPDWIFD